jgi:Skp family chaperone for outer membrane proteins
MDAQPGDAESAHNGLLGEMGGGAVLTGTEAVGIDKIRDLLFGNQMQDYDRRFAKLEERFLQRFKDVESETARTLSAFESNAKKHVDSLASQFRDEKDQRADADKELERTLRDQTQVIEKRVRGISDQLSQLERDMADRFTQELQAVRDEIKRRNEDMRLVVEKMFAEVNNVKTDRNLLAGLFIEVAKCLSQDAGKVAAKGNGPDPARGWPSS